MKSIERRFASISEKNKYWSSLISFTEAVNGADFSKDRIVRWFKVLVDRNDYERTDRKSIINQLVELSKKKLKRTKSDGELNI